MTRKTTYRAEAPTRTKREVERMFKYQHPCAKIVAIRQADPTNRAHGFVVEWKP